MHVTCVSHVLFCSPSFTAIRYASVGINAGLTDSSLRPLLFVSWHSLVALLFHANAQHWCGNRSDSAKRCSKRSSNALTSASRTQRVRSSATAVISSCSVAQTSSVIRTIPRGTPSGIPTSLSSSTCSQIHRSAWGLISRCGAYNCCSINGVRGGAVV